MASARCSINRRSLAKLGAAGSLVAALVVMGGPAPSQAAGPGPGLIAFSSGFILPDPDLGGPSQVYTVRPDGTQLRQLTHVPAGKHAGAPDISPDGSKIAYVSDVSGSFAVWAMKSDGTQQHRLFGRKGYDYFQPRWSPDGSRLLVSRCHQIGFVAPCDIVLTDADGSPQQVLVGGGRINRDATFSPDGKRIAFDSDRGGFFSAIWVMRLGGTPVRVTNADLEMYWPGWSPDGSHLVASDNCCRAASNVYTMQADGSRLTKLTHVTQGGGAGFASYSPDGKHIVFISDHLRAPSFNRPDLFVMNADGSNVHRIVSSVPAVTPDWSE